VTVRHTGGGIADPPIELQGGVAAIDLITLHKAGEAIAGLGLDILLPASADIEPPDVFDGLCRIHVAPGPEVTVTIDTRKMTWSMDSRNVLRDRLTDYTGADRRAVTFFHRDVCLVGGLGLATVSAKLKSGRFLDMWFAEIPELRLRALGYYGLYATARKLTETWLKGKSDERFTANRVTVPAQQIKWGRRMSEIVDVNTPQIEDVRQRIFMALDETGVRVKAEVSMRGSVAPWRVKPPRTYVFGERHPLVMWLTRPGSTLPFAVVATTAEAWLDPDAEVSFGSSWFGGRRRR
jgi:hypothetical protein